MCSTYKENPQIFNLSEFFYSIQGEGPLAGMPSVFIRLAGCRMQCPWCDTKYAWSQENTQDVTAVELINFIDAQPADNLVITGGEPMENPQLVPLLNTVSQKQRHVSIETAGTVFLPDLPCDLMIVSPKLSNTNITEEKRLNLHALNSLIRNYNCVLKFVIRQKQDIEELFNLISRISPVSRSSIFIMPMADCRAKYLEKAAQIAEWAIDAGLCFSPRLQLMLWDDNRGR